MNLTSGLTVDDFSGFDFGSRSPLGTFRGNRCIVLVISKFAKIHFHGQGGLGKSNG
jgi:hypothetical protein